MDYKSVFTNLCLELQQNRSWIKGLGKNPQKSELIHWRQCLLSGGTEACSLGLRETPACIHVIQRLSQPRVACWHGFRQNSQKTECVFHAVRQAVGKKIACIHGLRSEGVNHMANSMITHITFLWYWGQPGHSSCHNIYFTHQIFHSCFILPRPYSEQNKNLRIFLYKYLCFIQEKKQHFMHVRNM